MPQQIQTRRDTAATWASANPILAVGETGLEKDTGKTKHGDGATAWNSLLYSSGGAAAAYNLAFNVKAYGAKGDGTTDDTAAIQAAITASQASATPGTVLFPEGNYLISSGLTSSTSKPLLIRGAGKRSTNITVTTGFTGYMITTGNSFDICNLALIGNNLDGTYGIGSATGGGGTTSLRRLAISNTEYGLRFTGGWNFPLGAVFDDIYVYAPRTCGILVATAGSPNSGLTGTNGGQSAWRLDNIICTNGAAIPAAGLAQVNDSTDTTHDALSWSGTDVTEFGYVVMRLPAGSSDNNAWTHVAYVAKGTTSYSALKTVGTYWTYVVMRATQGVYLRYGKAVTIGSIQTEYFATGLTLREMNGVQINAFYGEHRGFSLTTPFAMGDGILVDQSTGVELVTGWAEGLMSFVSLKDSPGVRIGAVRANNCQRSIVHYSATDARKLFTLGAAQATGTPARVTTSGSSFDNNFVASNAFVADTATANVLNVNHTLVAEFEADYRGARSGVLGADSAGGYQWLSSSAPPTASAAYEGQIRRNGNVIAICLDLGGGYSWHPFTLG